MITKQQTVRVAAVSDAAAKLSAPGMARPRFHFLNDVEVENQPPQEWLVEDVLPAKALGEMHGPPGSAKTFFALALALCIATGLRLYGRSVQRGPVIYVSAEGSAGLGVRVAAWKHTNEQYGVAGVHFVTEPVELLEPGSVAEFLAAIDALNLSAPLRLIILDTLSRCLVGGEENSAKDVGLAIAAADYIRRATGAAVLLLHHVRKDGEVERGSGALRGAADVMIELKREDALITVTCSKQKDAPHFAPFTLELVSVQDSCVLITAKKELSAIRLMPGSKPHQLLRCLQDTAFDDGATSNALLKASGIPERDFYRTLKTVVAGGYVSRTARGRCRYYSLTESGQMAITDNCNIGAG